MVFLRVFSGEDIDLVCYSCVGQHCIGQEPNGTRSARVRFALFGCVVRVLLEACLPMRVFLLVSAGWVPPGS